MTEDGLNFEAGNDCDAPAFHDGTGIGGPCVSLHSTPDGMACKRGALAR